MFPNINYIIICVVWWIAKENKKENKKRKRVFLTYSDCSSLYILPAIDQTSNILY